MYFKSIFKWIKLFFFTSSREYQELLEINKSFALINKQFIDFFENEQFVVKGYHFTYDFNSFTIEDDTNYKPFPIKELSQYFITLNVSKTELSNAVLLRVSLKFTVLAHYTFIVFKSLAFFAMLGSLAIWTFNIYNRTFASDVVDLFLLCSLVFLVISLSFSLGDYYKFIAARKRLQRAINVFEAGNKLNYF